MTNARKTNGPRRSAAAFVVALALMAPGSALAHPGHPGGEVALPSDSSAQDDGGGGSSAVVIGGVLTGLMVLCGGLLYWREKQQAPAEGGATATPADKAERRDANTRARSSW
jgi:hypothetical protein